MDKSPTKTEQRPNKVPKPKKLSAVEMAPRSSNDFAQCKTLAEALAVGAGKRSSKGSSTTKKEGKISKPRKLTFFAPRKDAPVVRQPGRGSRSKALDVGRSAAAKGKAPKALRQDEVAAPAKVYARDQCHYRLPRLRLRGQRLRPLGWQAGGGRGRQQVATTRLRMPRMSRTI